MSATPNPQTPKASHAILFMLDGCRPDALGPATSPAIWRLLERGAGCLAAQTVMPSITLPCHTSLFYSLPPAVHGVVTNDWSPFAGATSLAEAISDAGYSTMAFYTWEQLRDLAAPGTLDAVYYHRYSEEGMTALVDLAATTIAALKPTFAFVYLEATDAAGHRFGWMSPEYRAAVASSDRAVAGVLAALEEAGILDQTFVVVMADHGGHGHSHGTDSEDDMTIPVIFSGTGVRQSQTITSPVTILDIAPTLLTCLSLPVPPHWQGRIVSEAMVDGGDGS